MSVSIFIISNILIINDTFIIKKRNRLLSSGTSEKRKSNYKYSTNTYIIRVRERLIKITRENLYKAVIERVKTIDNSFVIREVKKFKTINAF